MIVNFVNKERGEVRTWFLSFVGMLAVYNIF